MNSWRNKISFLAACGVLAVLLVSAPSARAQYQYVLDDGTVQERFNNSELDDTEDNWVANAFQVVAGGTTLISIDFGVGEDFTDQAVTAAIYMGTSVTDPSGLVRIATTEAVVNAPAVSIATITLDSPVSLNEGDVFYAALLVRGVLPTAFPFYNNTVAPAGQSFFDVGPNQGDPYDLDVTTNVTVFGGTHPVVGPLVQSPGNLILRVNAQ